VIFVRRNDVFFAVLLGLPVLTIGAAAVPLSGPTVQVAAVAQVHGAHGAHGAPSSDPSSSPSIDPSIDPSGSPSGDPSSDPSSDPSAQATPSAPAAAAATGPSPADFIDIRQVPPKRQGARAGRKASRGSFVSRCGNNRNAHRNPDNFIVAPGVSNGAHHTHDYVGNLSTDGQSTDQSLQQAGTTCRAGDKSTYFWPVLRVTTPGDTSGQDGNIGTILQPTVTLQFRGNAASKVRAQPSLLRIITGDAKAATNGGANGRAQWTCTGFTNRLTTKYPVCPRGSRVERILDFASCWDGKNTDSANHRTHVLFPDPATGACAAGLTPVPQLRMTLTYNVSQAQSRSIALDSFPEQLHNPVTDHGDFENVMPSALNSRVAACINRGSRC
jgi:hypothetical protein